jgi:hypothetical protein
MKKKRERPFYVNKNGHCPAAIKRGLEYDASAVFAKAQEALIPLIKKLKEHHGYPQARRLEHINKLMVEWQADAWDIHRGATFYP